MKTKNITLLFLLVSSFGNANEKNRDSEGLMLTLYPKNICDDPFDLGHPAHRDEDPFAETQREVDALLAGESTAPPPEPKKLADASQNSSQEEKTFNARIGYLSIYASDKPIAFFDGHGNDLEYIAKASVLHNFGSKEFDASGFVEFSDVQQFAISEHIEDSIDVGISVEVETLEVDGGLAASVSARFTEFEGFSEALGQVTPKFVSREFLFTHDDIGEEIRIFIYSDIIKEEHKTMFIVLYISDA
tara:strand:- start:788 stop:1525 length:738 start_codon:yes stop_codon:yes gene_type:complete